MSGDLLRECAYITARCENIVEICAFITILSMLLWKYKRISSFCWEVFYFLSEKMRHLLYLHRKNPPFWWMGVNVCGSRTSHARRCAKYWYRSQNRDSQFHRFPHNARRAAHAAFHPPSHKETPRRATRCRLSLAA